MTHARRTALLAVCALATAALASGAASAQGTELWAALYNGPANGPDTGEAVTTDAAGNVIVTGADYGIGLDGVTLKYDPDGNLVWSARYVGPRDDLARDVAVDENGEVYVVVTPFAVVKYSADGEELWRRVLGGVVFPGHTLALDSEGNVLVVGQHGTFQGAKVFDIAVAKLRGSDGALLWLRQWDGSNDQDLPVGLALGPDDSVYVAGTSRQGSNLRLATLRYSSGGALLWAGIGSSSSDSARGIGVDADGNVFTVATTYVSGQQDFRTVKRGPDGTLEWERLYNSGDYPGGFVVGTDQAKGLVVDGSGNVTVTGLSFTSTYPTTTGNDYATVQYDTNGDVRWVQRYNGPGSTGAQSERTRAIGIDAGGNIFVTGASTGANGERDIATVSYDPDGNERFVHRYDGPAGGFDDVVEGSAAIAATADRVYVVGHTENPGSSLDALTLALTNA
jgi:hypothetical protein